MPEDPRLAAVRRAYALLSEFRALDKSAAALRHKRARALVSALTAGKEPRTDTAIVARCTAYEAVHRAEAEERRSRRPADPRGVAAALVAEAAGLACEGGVVDVR